MKYAMCEKKKEKEGEQDPACLSRAAKRRPKRRQTGETWQGWEPGNGNASVLQRGG